MVRACAVRPSPIRRDTGRPTWGTKRCCWRGWRPSWWLPIARPEDLVIFKTIAWRPQDQQDVERLLVLHGQGMDLSRIRRHVRELGEAIEIDRLRDLERLVSRVLSNA